MKTIHEVVEEATAGTGASKTWPEKSRGEIDCEMTSLRQQLRTAHAAVSRTHTQMELQRKRTKQLIAAWKVRLEEGEEKTRFHKRTLDNQMKKVMSDLMYFEGALRKEQQAIRNSLGDKDAIISSQKQTIDSLTTANIDLTRLVKKLKRKYRETIRKTQETTSSELIQIETDALISQIFSNRQSNYTGYNDDVENTSPKIIDDAKNIYASDLNFENKPNSPQVGILTDKTERSKTPLKLKVSSQRYASSQSISSLESRLQQYPNQGESPMRRASVHSGYDQYRDHYQSQVNLPDQNITATNLKYGTCDKSPSKSFPNLGLAAIAEEINYIPDMTSNKGDTPDYIVDYPDVEDIESDVFNVSHNSCSSVSVLESSFTSSLGGVEDQVYESPLAQASLQRQVSFEEDCSSREPPDGCVMDEKDSNNGIITSKATLSQTRSPTKSSSFNLLRRIRRPRDVKKKKATRAKSEGDAIESVERQRKHTL